MARIRMIEEGDEEKWVNLRCILVLVCTGFGDGLDVAR